MAIASMPAAIEPRKAAARREPPAARASVAVASSASPPPREPLADLQIRAVERHQPLLAERHQGRLGAGRAEQVPDDGAQPIREIVLDLAHLTLGGAEQVHALEPQQIALLAAHIGRENGDPP